jgi:molecular chaperone DnaK (HSP70)
MPEDKADKKPADDKVDSSVVSPETGPAVDDSLTETESPGNAPVKSESEKKKAAPDMQAQAKQKRAKPVIRRLMKSVGMAMPSNRVRVFLGVNSIPPVSEKKQFVARLRKVDRIDISVLEGNEEAADKNLFVGELGLTNVKLRADGRAEIEVDYSLDEKGYLTVTIMDRLGNTEAIGRFPLPQFISDLQTQEDLSRLPVKELAEKIDLFEQQMQLLKGELTVRRERES